MILVSFAGLREKLPHIGAGFEGIWDCVCSFLVLGFDVLPVLQGQRPACWKRTQLFLVNSRCSGQVSSPCQALWLQEGMPVLPPAVWGA